ncbi:alpha/beta hydrolase [Massilia antarctica]|uniref:alpha/beta hydrolase n=1 Tax=Massilia antarctica TaxID=2765360 RepID=UPI0009E6DBAD|nr:alpha/beta hydrolase-fold protein [Massilia sp. H27-R4]MCY0916090.1 alpha/beta hydrolase-fold protein [Massilia sp. H27-R4]
MFNHPAVSGVFSMRTGVRRVFAVALLVMLSACGGGHDTPPAEPSLQTALTGSINSDLFFTSSQTHAGYRLNVYVPANYASTSDRLPVIYVLDGGPDNGIFVPMAHIAEGVGVRAVIVGIGGFATRSTDYRYPGLNPYYAFLTTELMPLVESKYRIAPEQRTLVGHSYGGYFAAAAMLLDRQAGHTFSNFIVMDMATHEQGGPLADMERAMFTATGGKLPGTKLILSGDTAGNAKDVDAFDRMISARAYQGLELRHLPTTSYGHVEMINPAYKESLRLIFKQ